MKCSSCLWYGKLGAELLESDDGLAAPLPRAELLVSGDGLLQRAELLMSGDGWTAANGKSDASHALMGCLRWRVRLVCC